MNRFFAALARFVVRYRFVVVALWIVVAVVASKSLPSMGSEVNNNNSQFLPVSAPSQQAAVLATPILGNTNRQSPVLVVASTTSGTLTAADQQNIAHVATALRGVTGVLSAKEAGVAPDGRAAEVTVNISATQDDITAQKTDLVSISHALAASGAPAGLQYHLAGSVATNVANQNSSNKTGGKVQALSFIFIIVLLLIIFRAPLAALITLLPPGFALVISMRFIGGLGAHGLQISEITELLLIVLLLGAGTDYGLFLVFRVREAIQAGRDPREAVAYSLARVGESISASAGTVILALLTLLFFDLFPVRHYLRRTVHASPIGEHMGMSANQFGIQVFNHVCQLKMAHFPRYLGIKQDLQQQISQLILQPLPVFALNGVQHLIGLFQRVTADGIEGLLTVPGTSARCAQLRHDANSSRK